MRVEGFIEHLSCPCDGSHRDRLKQRTMSSTPLMLARAAAARTPPVVVVGGGLLGAASAYHLSRAGLEVVVLERETPYLVEKEYASSAVEEAAQTDGFLEQPPPAPNFDYNHPCFCDQKHPTRGPPCHGSLQATKRAWSPSQRQSWLARQPRLPSAPRDTAVLLHPAKGCRTRRGARTPRCQARTARLPARRRSGASHHRQLAQTSSRGPAF